MKAEDRKRRPVFTGVIKYFPDAIMEISTVSLAGNEQHHPDNRRRHNKFKHKTSAALRLADTYLSEIYCGLPLPSQRRCMPSLTPRHRKHKTNQNENQQNPLPKLIHSGPTFFKTTTCVVRRLRCSVFIFAPRRVRRNYRKCKNSATRSRY